MEFLKILALRGPNVWAHFPVLEAWIDLGDWNDVSSEQVPGFNDRLLNWLPSLIEHTCSVGRRGGFWERLQRGTYPAHIIEHLALELQTLAGAAVRFGRARATSKDKIYKVAVQYREEDLGRAALSAARELLLACLQDQPYDVAAEIKRLRDLKHELALGPSTASIVNAAVKRGIPYRRLTGGSLVQLGQSARQRRILAAETDATPAIAEWIAQDKQLTRKLLQQIGVPVPTGGVVANAEEAWATAEEIGLPVVIKPQYGNQGRGVATNLTSKTQILAAYHAARKEGEEIIVETFAPGADWRVLVIGERVVAAARREPAQVIGDGRSTVRQLIDEANADPRRSDGHATSLSWIKLDDVSMAVLAEQDLVPESISAAGQVVLIRRNANLSTGGTAEDVTDRVHPLVAARCVEAAKMVGLDICGVDVVALDIGIPLEDQKGVIVEVNAAPGLRMHLEPSAGTPRNVGEAIVDLLFAPGQTGRIPLVAVTGTNGKTTTARLTAHLLRQTGRRTALTCTDGIYLDDRRLETGDCAGPGSATAVLMNPLVEAAVLETARGGILRAGLAFDQCDVAIVTNIAEGDHLGLSDIETPEQLAVVKRCIVDVVKPQGTAVLNGDDPLTVNMQSYCPGSVLFFSPNEHAPALVKHRASGGKTAFVRDNCLILAEGEIETLLLPLTQVPLTHGGKIGFQVENALASAAAAWAVGVPVESIRMGLQTFVADLSRAPGRFNVIESGGATVIVDYGHNTAALRALAAGVKQFAPRQSSIIFTVAGDRRDRDIVDQGELLGNDFDTVRIYEDACNRGRRDGEVIALLREGLAKSTENPTILESRGERATIDAALADLQPGDLLVIQADNVEATVTYLKNRLVPPVPSEAPGAPMASGSSALGSKAPSAAPTSANPTTSQVANLNVPLSGKPPFETKAAAPRR
ncbi:MAG TPA: cyanophycin synthetase [Pirellulales bacterium]|jgi:cyanophycin synthetase|nr:cyanophycin synthetase [Pirellulales bacterium]